MKRCKTCRWWVGERECDFGNTTIAAKLFAEKPEVRFEVVAGAADDHNLWSELRTGPDFGCIHHEEQK